MTEPLTESADTREVSLGEIALVFLKLGTIAFGGPAAHLAMMEEEFVRRRRWITQAEFLDRLATANLIPGPSSTEVAIFIGQLKRGWRGLLVAGCCFIIPAALIVLAIAWAYVRFGSLPKVEGVLSAIKPAVVAIVIQALVKLGRTGVRAIPLAVIAMVAAVLSFAGVGPVLVLIFTGLGSWAVWALKKRSTGGNVVGISTVAFPKAFEVQKIIGAPKMAAAAVAVASAGAVFPAVLWRLFLSFLKIGSVMFGSGMVLLAFLQTEFVEHLHWLTERQLFDAVAVGQFTPGPLSATATFIGYIVAGWKGAVVATIGIFLPGFLLVAASGPLLPRLRRSAGVAAALDGVVAGSLALMGVVAWQLAKGAIVDWMTAAVLCASLVALLRFRVNSAWVIAAAAMVGWMVR
ncbi:MAG: chromate efflux transporter [Terriglobales bacterium]